MKILFMCVANSARSQMAEAIAKSVFKQDAQIFSAGSSPKSVHPLTIDCLMKNNIDPSSLWSKSINDLPAEFTNSIDFVITLCAEEVCPVLPNTNARKLHWPMPDPAATNTQESFQSVFNEIKFHIAKFHDEKPLEF